MRVKIQSKEMIDNLDIVIMIIYQVDKLFSYWHNCETLFFMIRTSLSQRNCLYVCTSVSLISSWIPRVRKEKVGQFD